MIPLRAFSRAAHGAPVTGVVRPTVGMAVGGRQGDTCAVSRAFVKDQDEDQGVDDIPDRVVSPHRNLVTATGLAQIDDELRRSRDGLTAARSSADRAEVARHRRDLRYWSERRTSAELVPAPPESDKVRFGCTVTLAPARGEPRTFRIVGEDEASPAEGRISYVSPLAQSLLGGQVGDVVPFGDGESEIARIGS
jgi:transcription elongation GreA/GreB family factor